jgi:cytochrome c oxidase subunit II
LAPLGARHRRRLLALAFLGALLVALLIPTGALADALTPESGGSPNADDIDSLYKVLLYVAVVVLVGVEGTLLYSLLRFRRRKGKVAAQIRGNTNLEIGWTVLAGLVLVILVAVTFIKLPSIKDPARSGANGLFARNGQLVAAVDQPPPPGGKALRIDINGQQYIWRFTYPNGAFSYETMVVPVNTTILLRIQSQDVAHSWWIPKLGPKFDAIPGYVNKSWFKIPKPGTYRGQCAELCGRNHANMIAAVRAVPVDEYRSWVSRQLQQIQQANQEAVQQRKSQSPIPG